MHMEPLALQPVTAGTHSQGDQGRPAHLRSLTSFPPSTPSTGPPTPAHLLAWTVLLCPPLQVPRLRPQAMGGKGGGGGGVQGRRPVERGGERWGRDVVEGEEEGREACGRKERRRGERGKGLGQGRDQEAGEGCGRGRKHPSPPLPLHTCQVVRDPAKGLGCCPSAWGRLDQMQIGHPKGTQLDMELCLEALPCGLQFPGSPVRQGSRQPPRELLKSARRELGLIQDPPPTLGSPGSPGPAQEKGR